MTTTRTLNDLMEFDHVIEVHEDGTITEPDGVYAPELFDDYVSQGWKLLNGFSGQYRYAGPIMHPSEYIGGAMEEFIRTSPGIYVSLVAHGTCDERGCDERGCEHCEGGLTVDGWAVAYRCEVSA